MMTSDASPRPTGPVRKIMMWPVAATPHGATMRRVAESLAADEIGALPITANGSIVGMVSERDIARHIANGADPDHLCAADIMSTDVLDVAPETEIVAAARLMLDAGVRHLLVREDGAVAGIISVRDVLSVLTDAAAAEVAPATEANDYPAVRLHRRVR
jgi:predicted transcriptional regulator